MSGRSAVPQASLNGEWLTITGRLASMSRAEAVQCIAEKGGHYSKSPTTKTSYIVIGQQGWPLRRDGHLTQDLQKAKRLAEEHGKLKIITEAEFLALLGLDDRQGDIQRLYTSEQLSRILAIPLPLIRTWIRAQLIRPVKTIHRLCYFDFEQVAGAKVLIDLSKAGVTSHQIRRSLEQLQAWFPGAKNSLAQLGMLERDGRLLVRLTSGQLAEPSGQLQLEFSSMQDVSPVVEPGTTSGPRISKDWFEQAIRLEEAEDFEGAAQAYHQALVGTHPEPEFCFNFGNVLYRQGRKEGAVQRFMQAAELDPNYVEAWNNLGNVLAELGRSEQAVRAYQTALRVEPNYADAHYNLAETLDSLDRKVEAEDHWRAYLKLDPHSSWARQVRERLDQRNSGHQELRKPDLESEPS